MALFRISGVWKNNNDIITHYAFHTIESNSMLRAVKTSKADAVRLLEIRGNAATTLTWNYNKADWNVGQVVEVVNGEIGKYLRSDRNNRRTDNLMHLIDYDWVFV